MLVDSIWRTNTNALHSNRFDVIMHAVDHGGSLQYFFIFIQSQSTEINIISWHISKMSYNVMHTYDLDWT